MKSEVFARFTERWPQTGDCLLSLGRDVFIASNVEERKYRLLEGYKLAGDILIENAYADVNEGRNLVFPALFSYRHYIELALKRIIEEHGSFAHVHLVQMNHNLIELWAMFEAISSAFGEDCADPAARAVAACVAELQNIDPPATTWRYALDRKGASHAMSQRGIDIIALRDTMNGIENFFQCAYLHFSQLKDDAAEAAAAFRDWEV